MSVYCLKLQYSPRHKRYYVLNTKYSIVFTTSKVHEFTDFEAALEEFLETITDEVISIYERNSASHNAVLIIWLKEKNNAPT